MTPSPSLLAALRHLLRPLVRLLTAHGVTYPMLADLLKQAYAEVAVRHFGLDARAPSDSRVSLLTGLHRKDVKRLRGAGGEAQAMPQMVALGAQLAAAWSTRRDLRDRKGRPRPLPRLASQGGERSFEGLVASISKDIRARPLLDEWLRLGVAQIDDQDRVVLRSAGFVPSRGFDEKAFYLGHNVHDHLAAAAHNLQGEGAPFLERSVHYEGLQAASVAQLAALAEKTGMEALQAVYRKARDCESRDRKTGGQKQRLSFGIYFYSEPAKEEPSG
ncbi:MAG TPA: DUF6502 family protein [Burkholderiales bacterium]